jgi:hypothetical protein
MKKIALVFNFLLLASLAFGQAKKPTIMIMPSDDWCVENRYIMQFDNQGVPETRSDFEAAFLTYPNLNSVIGKIDAEMRKDAFPTVLMINELKNLKQQRAEDAVRKAKGQIIIDPIQKLREGAKADFEFKVYWKVVKQGPRHRIESFRLQGIDTYTGKAVGYAEGAGDWASASEVSEGDLLREAIQSKMDGFKSELQTTFNTMFQQGREVIVSVATAPDWEKNLNSTFADGDELNEIIETWIAANTKEHRYGSPETNKNNMLAKGCMIPLFNENNMPIDAKGWVKPLKKYLLNDLKIPGVCVYPVGLGKVEIFLSGVPCDQQ